MRYQFIFKNSDETLTIVVKRDTDQEAIEAARQELKYGIFHEVIIRQQLTADSCGPVKYLTTVTL